MEQWKTYFVNDPDDDFNIVMEVLYDDIDVVAVIKPDSGKIIMRWYPYKEVVDIPIDFLSELVTKDKEEFKDV